MSACESCGGRAHDASLKYHRLPAPSGKICMEIKAPATASTAPGCGRTGLEFDMHDASPERWLPIAEFKEYAEVSDRGRVRSLDREIWVEPVGQKPYLRIHKGKILKQARHPAGYMYITLSGGGKLLSNAKVHHLVLEAFIGPRPPGMECCHANDVPADNRLENLRWDTPAANVADRVANGKNIKTWCPAGHEYTPENTRILVNPPGAKRCRQCQRDRYQPKARTYPYVKAACR